MSFLNVGLTHILILSSLLFTIGMVGLFLNRKNIIVVLMCLEMMLLAVNINFVAFSTFSGDVHGQIFTLFILAIAAAEVAIGLAILTCFYRTHGNVDIDRADRLKG